MISVQINDRGAEMAKRLGGRIYAVFSYRYDAHLVPDMLENIRPFVDGWVSFDDRQATDLFSNEPLRRQRLLDAAISAGARWVLAIDPDERIESGAVEQCNDLLLSQSDVAWAFNFREMYAVDAYRVDGVWGRKKVARLFPARPLNAAAAMDLHANWFDRKSLKICYSEINLYHLKMIDPKRRMARRDLYKALDPNNSFQPIGYDYIADETNAEFEKVPAGREYNPPHVEDGELWMPDV
jgi:hypothetical protein